MWRSGSRFGLLLGSFQGGFVLAFCCSTLSLVRYLSNLLGPGVYLLVGFGCSGTY
ncbi:hypothetical protein BDV32DRAFT_127080 [Aspergillus pseudonomiae]|nr:hypothetical protein BDV32DRAFT_127080 [Aspergillus pseudonomiae]